MFPVLSMDEDGIVYAFLNDIEYVDTADSYGQIIGRQLVLNAHYVVRLDLVQNRVLYSKKSPTNSLAQLAPSLLASDFSAYLHGSKSKYRQVLLLPPTHLFHFNFTACYNFVPAY